MNKKETSDKKAYKISAKNSGFTLVEVIVVVVIMAIGASVAVPKMKGYMELSSERNCLANRERLNEMFDMIYTVRYTWSEKPTMAQMLNGEYADCDVSDIKCPNKGEYSPSRGGLGINVICSVHGGEEEPSETLPPARATTQAPETVRTE